MKSFHRRLESIFEGALSLPPDERSRFLDEQCEGDASLRTEVESLLDLDSENSPLEPAVHWSVDAPPDEIGPYQIIDLLGEGGMGTVYLAEQRQPLQRKVALKVIRLGMSTRDVITRFESERQALALMEHHHIARVHDAGVTGDGRPYFAMEYVPGAPITEHADEQRLDVTARLRLFIQVCEGVQHAHQKGIVHRDLKPSNILVIPDEGGGTPKVIDFGVAKALHERLTERTLFTASGALIGTPEYMSPEQACASAEEVDTRSDVYSLGVVLYELMAGSLPFDSGTIRRSGLVEIQRIIGEQEPMRPSQKLLTLGDRLPEVAAQRHTDGRGLARLIRGDLDWIILHALEKAPQRRYGSASELAADILRHLDNEPVAAGPPSTLYRVKKFVRRQRVPVTTAALLLITLVAGLVTSLILYSRSEERLAEITRLADLKRLAEYSAAADAFWPPHPEHIEGMEQWLRDKAEPLAARYPLHVATLAQLREQAVASDPEARLWTFETLEAQWQHDTLAGLVEELGVFLSENPHQSALCSVQKRLDFAQQLDEQTISGDEARRRWSEALHDIRSLDVYRGLDLQPQMGLLPLRRDPASGLWEFWQVMSGDEPQLDPDPDATTSWKLIGPTGMVLVLIPGGTFFMGAQRSDPEGPNFWREAAPEEVPVEEAAVPPFFLARYEMTQGQWIRYRGENPSMYYAGNRVVDELMGWDHPVEQISWFESVAMLRKLGLRLPAETEWEYACRAGTTTPWWTGPHKQSLQGKANIADASFRKTPSTWDYDPDLDDGHLIHSSVGSFEANHFGLEDMIGNVWEWVQDDRSLPAKEKPSPRELEIYRGGSWYDLPREARSACRPTSQASSRYDTVGVRAARSIERR